MNIIKTLEKEMEKGNDYILPNGVIGNEEKLQDELRKSYTKGMKDGSIDIMETSFKQFVGDVTVDILTVQELLEYITSEPIENEEPSDNVEPTDSTEEREE